MADVSVDALQKVKSALSTFQSDIAGMSLRTNDQVQNCLSACHQKLDETQAKIEEIESAITKLNNKIETLDEQIGSATSQIQQLENAIPQMERRLRSIEMEINSLQQQRSALQAQLADTDDDEVRDQIQSQINRVTQQLSSLYREQSELEHQIKNYEKQKSSLQQKITDYKSEKARYEEQLAIARKRKSQYQQKFDRLKTLFGTAKSTLDDYTNAVRKFESSSSSHAEQNVQVVDKCIDCIEEYLSINL